MDILKINRGAGNINNTNNEPAMKFAEAETIIFDENNNMESLNITAGEAKVINNGSKSSDKSVDEIMSEANKEKNTITVHSNFEYIESDSLKKSIEENKSIIDEYSKKWGISPNLIAAIYCQETSAGTNEKKDNDMQIDFGVHNGQKYEVYNFKDKRYEKIIITDKPDEYKAKGYITISEKELSNPLTAISIASVILASNAKTFNYHVGSTIQSYNFGESRTKRAINMEGDFNTITNSQQDLNFMRNNQEVAIAKDENGNIIYNKDGSIKRVGDSNYLNNVLRYIKLYDGDSTITFKNYDGNSVKEVNVNILPNNMN